MNIKHQERIIRSSGIGDFLLSSACPWTKIIDGEAYENRSIGAVSVSLGMLIECSGDSDHLSLGASCSDGIDGSLDRGCPEDQLLPGAKVSVS